MKRFSLLLSCLGCLATAPCVRAQPESSDFGSAMWAGAGLADEGWVFGRTASQDRRGRASLTVRQVYGLPDLRPIHARIDANWTRAVWVSVGLSALSLEGYRRHAISTGLTAFPGAGLVEATLRVAVARAGELPARRAAAISVTTRYPLSRRLSLAASIDPVMAVLSPREVGIASQITIGMAWLATPDVRLVVDRTHRRPNAPALAVGIAWHLHPSFELRLGGSTDPVFRSAGFLLHLPILSLGLLASHHDPLGWTTGVGVEWSW